jgi:hypothetical protein
MFQEPACCGIINYLMAGETGHYLLPQHRRKSVFPPASAGGRSLRKNDEP